MTRPADRKEIGRTFDVLYPPGAVVEMRVPKTRAGTYSGYFDDREKFIAAGATVNGHGPGVYVTINPVAPALLARACNRIRGRADVTTNDRDVARRCWILLDFDPIRPTGISSTDAEHRAALAAARAASTWLGSLGAPGESMVLANSGNGAHLLLHVDLPNDEPTTRLVQRCLDAVALYCSTADVAVDRTVFNAGRILKLYGTTAMKGDATAERPHRRAHLIEVPADLVVVSVAVLEYIAATLPADDPRDAPPRRPGEQAFDIRAWLAEHGLGIHREKPWHSGAVVLELAVCPFNAEHARSAVVIVEGSGRILFRCLHDSCRDKRWHDVRGRFEPARAPEQPRPAARTVRATPAKAPSMRSVDPATAAHRPGDLAGLLDCVVGLLEHYVVFRHPAEVTAIALWIAHTHVLDAFDVTPYLHLHSAEKRSGKTRLLEIIEALVPRPWRALEASEPVLFRKIARDRPVLLFDEVDSIFTGPKSKTPTAEGVRAVLNAGYRRGAVVPRCGGKNFEQLLDFEVFGAKVLAGLGTVPDTIADRCIPIRLVRRKKGERRAPFRFRELEALASPIRAQLAEWAAQTDESLGESRPDVPAALEDSNDRAAEIWEPLLAIADAAGPRWSSTARTAACTLHRIAADTESTGVQLLYALKAVFAAMNVDRLLTVDLLTALIEREGEPWAERWGQDIERACEKGTPPRRAAAQLAGMLRPFEVLPGTLRTPSGANGKGYKLEDFADAFERYVTLEAPLGRHNDTTVAAQGVEASRSHFRSEGIVTPETLGAQGLSPCDDLEGHLTVTAGSEGISTGRFEGPPTSREPGEDDPDEEEIPDPEG